MQDEFAVARQRHDGPRLGQISLDQFDTRRHVLTITGGKIVRADDGMPICKKPVGDMCADEATNAGDEHLHCFPSFFNTATSVSQWPERIRACR